MSDATRDPRVVLEEMRQSFDAAFAAPPASAPTGLVDLLAITVAGHAYALRLNELSGVLCDRVVTPLPTSLRSLVGISASRGTLLPVHSLAYLLGHESAGGERWLAVLAGRVALSFDRFDGHLRLEGGRIEAARAERLVAGVVRTDGGVRAVLDAAKILDSLSELAGQARRRNG